MIEVEDIKEMKTVSVKVSYYENKTKVLQLDHMSQHRVQHVGSYHGKSKKQPLTCQHYGKYGHTNAYCFEWLKLNIRGRKEDHAKKKWKSNVVSTNSRIHTDHRGSLRKEWYGTMHMAKDKTALGVIPKKISYLFSFYLAYDLQLIYIILLTFI